MITLEDVLKVLENGKFMWRTINGISDELNVDPLEVAKIIENNRMAITVSPYMNEKKQPLFASFRRLKSSILSEKRVTIDEFTRFVKW